MATTSPHPAPLARRPLRRQNPRQEPSAVVPHAGICAGGRQQWRSLPRPPHRLCHRAGTLQGERAPADAGSARLRRPPTTLEEVAKVARVSQIPINEIFSFGNKKGVVGGISPWSVNGRPTIDCRRYAPNGRTRGVDARRRATSRY